MALGLKIAESQSVLYQRPQIGEERRERESPHAKMPHAWEYTSGQRARQANVRGEGARPEIAEGTPHEHRRQARGGAFLFLSLSRARLSKKSRVARALDRGYLELPQRRNPALAAFRLRRILLLHFMHSLSNTTRAGASVLLSLPAALYDFFYTAGCVDIVKLLIDARAAWSSQNNELTNIEWRIYILVLHNWHQSHSCGCCSMPHEVGSLKWDSCASAFKILRGLVTLPAKAFVLCLHWCIWIHILI